MRILLPPSEAKTPGGRGTPLAGRTRPHPLDEPRRRVLAALTDLLRDEPDAIQRALLLPPSVVSDTIAANRAVGTSRTRPALDRYAGIVYDGLAASTFSPSERRTAETGVLVFSGLFGVVGGGEPLPDYRVPAKATLPGIGITGTFWKPWLAEALPRMLGHGPIVDLRSSDYAAMWRPRPDSTEAARLVGVRILSPRPDGSMGVISYPSKYFKGVLAAALIRSAANGTPITGPADVAEAWLAGGGLDATVVSGRGSVTVDLFSRTSAVVGVV